MSQAYGIRTTVKGSYEETIPRVTDALKQEGFGILTQIDVKETLKKKLDVDFPKYIILGACNPPLAHQALTAETEIVKSSGHHCPTAAGSSPCGPRRRRSAVSMRSATDPATWTVHSVPNGRRERSNGRV